MADKRHPNGVLGGFYLRVKIFIMTLFKDKYRVESTRLPGWDYGNAGYYYITICTKDRTHFFW